MKTLVFDMCMEEPFWDTFISAVGQSGVEARTRWTVFQASTSSPLLLPAHLIHSIGSQEINFSGITWESLVDLVP
jgi:hypothetical protein